MTKKNESESLDSITPFEGRIVANYGTSLEVEGSSGELYRCTARRKLGCMVCGDRVLWRKIDGRHGVIERLLPRRTTLARPDTRGRMRPIAANIDFVIVAAAPSPGVDRSLIDRYLVAAEHTGITPLILINKIDLLTGKEISDLDRHLSVYRKIGYRLVYISAKKPHNLDELSNIIKGKYSIITGVSGVGKSSLVNALLPGTNARVGKISQASGKGVHTTTTARLYHLSQGGAIIDSPGVRDFGPGPMSVTEIAHGFVEFAPYAEHCRFRDCTHCNEPGCAIIAAAENGDISMLRLDSYKHMLSEFGQ